MTCNTMDITAYHTIIHYNRIYIYIYNYFLYNDDTEDNNRQ